MSDHPTTRDRDRSGRRDVLLGAPPAERAPQGSRSRLPLPPVPVGGRSGGGPAPRPPVAPARPVPAAEPRIERATPARPDVMAPVSAGEALFPKPVHSAAKAAAPSLTRSGSWVEDEALVTTGPGRGPRPAPRVPRVPRQTTPSGAPASSYGDWTKPSRADGSARAAFDLGTDLDLPQALVPSLTTAIPERNVGSKPSADFDVDEYDDYDEAYADEYDDELELDDHGAPAAVRGPVKGGRAAYRTERQAADSARRRAAKKNGTPEVIFEDEEERKPRLILKSLIAMAVVALVVLGVYTVTQPTPKETSTQTPAAPTTVAAPAIPTAELPPLANEPISLEPEVATGAKLPVTVLNATTVTGLAGKISSAVVAGGWESPGVGAYKGTPVATTTVFYTEGDEAQRQAATELVAQFPQLAGPAARFFEVSDVPAPGLVIVATGNWTP